MCLQCDLPNFSDSFFDLSTDLCLNNSFSSLDSLSISSPVTPIQFNCTNSKRPTRAPEPKPKRRKLKGMIINCNGLKSTSRFTEFQALLDLHDLDFVLGTESKLQQDISSYSIFPSNYTVFRNDRNRHGGGVFQAVKSDLVCVEESEFANDCKIVWTSLKLSNCKTLYLSTFYRPPNSPPDVLDKLHDSISRVFTGNSNHPNVIIGGDFNLGDIDWNSEVPVPCNVNTASQHNKLLQLIDDYSLTQHVKSATRPASGKVLDLLLSTYPNSVQDITTACGISDHLAVVFEVNLKPTRTVKPPHKVYSYKKANFEGLNEHMRKSSSVFFSSNPQDRSVEENWNIFKKDLSDGMSQFIPQKTSRPKFKLPWINPNIKREMRKKDRLHKKAIQSKKSQHWRVFKCQRNYVTKLVKVSHNHYLNEIIGGSLTENPKKFWSYVKNSKSENVGIPPLKLGNSVSITDKDKAETLNSYFHSVFTQEHLPSPSMGQSPYLPIVDLQIDPEGVAKQLSVLNPQKACGPDELPARVLKEVAQSVSHWLGFIFQQSYVNNTVPSDWSQALVTAVFKSDIKSNPANYRPISLTCICCKIMEHIVLSHMAKHLSVNNILIDEQHGFRKRLSC